MTNENFNGMQVSRRDSQKENDAKLDNFRTDDLEVEREYQKKSHDFIFADK